MTARVRVDQMQAYIRAGLQLIPLHRWDVIDAKGRPRGKTPRDGSWQAREYDSDAVLKNADREQVNVGVRLPASIMVLDVDPRNFGGGDSLLSLMIDTGMDLRGVPQTATGSGGSHYWFSKPIDATLLDSLESYPGVEFKSLGRQVVAAGSTHPNGTMYTWAGGVIPDLRELPDIPSTLLALIRRPVRSHGESAGLGELGPQQLHETLEQLDPCDFKDHDEWLTLMMACHHATNGEGRQEFIDWSTQDADYQDDAWIIGRRWDSLHAESGRGGKPVTVRYLHKVVQAHGGEVARTPPEDDFETWDGDEVEEGEGVDDDRIRNLEPPVMAGAEGVIDSMNELHAVVMEGGRFRIFTEETDPVLNRLFYQRSTKEDFENLYCNQLVEVADRLVTKSTLWIKSGKRRQYKGVVFDPEREHKGWLNLWKGWSVQPVKGDWSLLKQLILETLVGGSQEYYEYVMNWLAYTIQKPSCAAEVAICFKGQKGTGKGTLGRAMAQLAGAHGLHISSPEHLIGRFNSHLQNCIFLFADEAFWAGDKAGESKLKQLVTEPTLTYEGKGRDAITGKNLIHVMMASNSDWIVPAGLDGERRFAVFDVLDNRRGDKDFFNALNRQMYMEGGLKAMLHELGTRDLKDWAPRDGVPATHALVSQKIESMDDVEKWWYGRLVDGILTSAVGQWEDGSVTVIKSLLRAEYAEYARDQRMYKPADDISFGMRLAKLVKLGNTQVKPTDSDFGVKVDRNGRASAYKLPSLKVCRESMEQRLDMAMPWEKEDS